MWVLGVRVLGVDQAGIVLPQFQQFQLLRGAAAGPARSQRGSPSSPRTRMMTRMMISVVVLVTGTMVRLQGVAGVVEAVLG